MFKQIGMEYRRTANNYILVKLDPENTSIKLKSGYELYIDTSFDPEKHQVVTGTVWGTPSKLEYTGVANKGLPWQTDMEVKCGDKVVVYYLSIVNALKPEQQRYFFEGGDKYVLITYNNIFTVYGDGFVRPVNGYVLIEPCEDPFLEKTKERIKKLGLEYVQLNTKSNTNVSFGIVRYMGKPNREYVDDGQSDEGVDVKVGDVVVLRKVSDIPLQYNLHAKIDEGKLYYRVQRRKILAVI